jgi:putative DNA primase/helicase
MTDRFAETLRWDPVSRRWMCWRSGRWEPGTDDSGTWMAQVVIESLAREEHLRYSGEAEEQGEPSPRAAFLKWARQQRAAAAGVSACVCRLARARPVMQIDLDHCDAEPLQINCRNGVYDAATGTFTEHDPAQMLAMQAAVNYDPAAICPRWDAFFEQVQPDPEMRSFIMRVWGYSMTGDVSEQALFIHHGGGRTGKSVAQDVTSSIDGGYRQVVPIDTMLASRNKGAKIPNDVARMRGKRFLKCSETSEGRRLDEALLKSLTGGEEQVARFMRAEFFQFRMAGKVHLKSNFLSQVADEKAN